MPKSNVLSNATADAVTSEKFYNDTLVDLARENWFTNAEVVAATPSTNLTLANGQVELNLNDLAWSICSA